ncbi:MAG: FAD-dependent oxidoreductase [Aeromicrobium sp.]|uniref:FAD-dependent oxidoreductase n=1 Tax=Aeromicrobium sp. TaxID=1871063 RepID=UPI00261401D3|nr:FAD-dependent oxidoreductase [Aeromicrobium sp.]MDF1706200.1 FAD-dependent oxidoreductase [Aeromicrobium sp.]
MEDALNGGPADTAQVVVVGAGATGATTALLLARLGIATIVLERRATPLLHPAAHVLSARSFEIWHQASPRLCQEISALVPPIETVSRIQWRSTFAAAPLGEIDLLSEPDRLAEVQSHSEHLISHVGQHLLMPVLWDALRREELVDLRLGTTVQDVVQERGGACQVRTRDAEGRGETLRTPFVIGADGANSTVRDLVDVPMEGTVLANMGSVFFRSTDRFTGPGPVPMLSWIYQPDFCGVLISHADDHYVLMGTFVHPAQEMPRDPEAYWRRLLPRVLGEDVVTEIRSTGTWIMRSELAATFWSGSVLLAGDAAHRFPHTGGFGLNSGVQDAHNLAWKLAAVLRGAPADLLDTYEDERRPVVRTFADQSVANHFLLDQVTAQVGVTNRALQRATLGLSRPPLTWLPHRLLVPLVERLTAREMARTAVLTDPGPRGERAREHMAVTIPEQLEHFVSTGLELGYQYRSRLVDGSGPVRPLDDVTRYVPTSEPGARVPHVPVASDRGEAGVHAAVPLEALMLVTPDPDAWSDALKGVDHGVAVQVRGLAAGASRGRAIELLEVGARGAVLVRPDGHVAWRSPRSADEDAEPLLEHLRRVWRLVLPDRDE